MTERRYHWVFWGITAVAVLVGATVVVRGTSAFAVAGDSDLANFFLKSADRVLSGDPLHIYAVRGDPPLDENPNDGPPILVFLLAPFLALARGLSLGGNFRAEIAIVSLPFVLVVPLLGWLAMRVVRNLDPDISLTRLLTVYGLITLSPLVWLCYVPWGHLEIPLMLCGLLATMLALREERELLAGLLAGVTLLVGLTAVFPLLAIAAMMFAAGQMRTLIRFGAIAVAVVVVGLAPFVIADRQDVYYSLVTFRPGRAIGGNSIWALVMNVDSPARLAQLLRRLDIPTAALVALGAGYAAGSRLRVRSVDVDAWAPLAIGALALPMLIKANWPYYYAAPFLLMLLWEAATSRQRPEEGLRWPLLSAGFLLVTATLGQYIGLRSIGVGDRVLTGLVEFSAMAAFALAIWWLLQTLRPTRTEIRARG
jgi:hypothetical protein